MKKETDIEKKDRIKAQSDYIDFISKLHQQNGLTTDDCITPPDVYYEVLRWVRKRYNIPESATIMRPFYPGGDYERTEYPEGAYVIDNPPFSILRRIVEYYNARRIPYFLFANGLTALTSSRLEPGTTTVFIGRSIRYDNGMEVNTAFVTNMSPGFRIELSSYLSHAIHDVQHHPPPSLMAYNPAKLGELSKKYNVLIVDAGYIRKFNDDRPFGGATVIDNEQLGYIAEHQRMTANTYIIEGKTVRVIKGSPDYESEARAEALKS